MKSLLTALGCVGLLPLTACGDSSTPTREMTDLNEDVSGPEFEVDIAPEDVPRRECDVNSECEGRFAGLGQCESVACKTDSGRCVRLTAVDGEFCSDRNACTTDDRCLQGRCASGAPEGCDDDNVCTSDGCEPRTGCVHASVEGRCDDANACTTRDQCDRGRCRGTPRVCDDGNACTEDGCDPVDGCVFRPIEGC